MLPNYLGMQSETTFAITEIINAAMAFKKVFNDRYDPLLNTL